jgi:hypothetical protein
MNTFATALNTTPDTHTSGRTANHMGAHATSTSALVDLFFIVGSARKQDISAQFIAALETDPVQTLIMLFWARDVRGGAGERDTFRKLMCVAEQQVPDLLKKVMHLIPEYGRYDDLSVFETPELRDVALKIWCDAIRSAHGLACKWAPRQNKLANELRKRLGWDPKTYRKWLVQHTQVVETAMCAGTWDQINYSHVPSVASARYAKAFGRHDPVRYTEFKAAALKGDAKIHAGALYPYDVLRTIRNGDEATALAQWGNLPNYLGDAGMILPVIDTSGSMMTPVGGQKGKGLTCMDVAISLGLYLADKQQGPFANMFLNFDSHSHIHMLKGNLLEKVSDISKCKWDGTTNLESAFKEILRVAVMGSVTPDQMPKTLLIISDMGFDPYSGGINHTAMQMARDVYARHNYNLPQIVWWNVAHRVGGYGGDHNFPVCDQDTGAALISGFSPSILKSVLKSEHVTPWDIMMTALTDVRYAPVKAALVSGAPWK